MCRRVLILYFMLNFHFVLLRNQDYIIRTRTFAHEELAMSTLLTWNREVHNIIVVIDIAIAE